MFRLGYMFCEFLAMWSILVSALAFAMWITVGFSDVYGLLFILFVIGAVPNALITVTVGPRFFSKKRSSGRHQYRPLRPLAFILPAIPAYREPKHLPRYAHRRNFQMGFNNQDGQTAGDMILLLARHLRQQGIKITVTENLLVEDNRTLWYVEPVYGQASVIGWVSSNDPTDIEQIMSGLRDFLAAPGTLHDTPQRSSQWGFQA